MSDTPETDRMAKAACDDTGGLCRPEILWDGLERLERQRNDALQLARELRDALKPTLTLLVGRMTILDTDAVEKAHTALTKANQLLK